MLNYAYDVEIWRNCFMVTFVNLNDYLNKCKEYKVDSLNVQQKKDLYSTVETLTYIIHNEDDKDLTRLASFLTTTDIYNLYGFNNIGYDKWMLIAFLVKFKQFNRTKDLTQYLYQLSQVLINDIQNDKTHYTIWNHNMTKLYSRYKTSWRDVDIRLIFALDKVGKSAKQLCMNLEWYNVEDYHLPPIKEGIDDHYYKKFDFETWEEVSSKINDWDRFIPLCYLDSAKSYNINDTLIVCEAVRQQQEEIRLRYNISRQYGIEAFSASRSKTADLIIEKLYSQFSGLEPEEFKNDRTHREWIQVGECIPDLIQFITPEFNNLLTDYKSKSFHSDTIDGALSYEFTYNGTTYTLGLGGLHSKDKSGTFGRDGTIIRDADVTSYYPFIILNFGICPEHINPTYWYNIMKHIINERVVSKKVMKQLESKYKVIPDDKIKEYTKHKTTNEALKIVLNSGGFGKMGFKESFMYDPKAMTSTTITGQLLLLMLIERLELAGIHVISANTDGIVSVITNEDEYNRVCKEWMQLTGFELEYTDYEYYVRRDVNAYLAVKPDGKVKLKGALSHKLHKEDYQKGYSYPIVAKCVSEYFVKGVPVMETLKDCKDILQFCKAQKMSKEFELIDTRVINGVITETTQSKHTRFYISNTGGILMKRKQVYGGTSNTRLCAGQYSTILNKQDDSPVEKRDISYKFYYDKAMEIISIIEIGIKDKRKLRKKTGFIGGLFD